MITIVKNDTEDGKKALLTPAIFALVSDEVGILPIIQEQELMFDTAKWVEDEKNHALGMAAQQVGGKYAWFVMKFLDGTVRIVVNPKVIGKMGAKSYIETCFSETLSAKVRRPTQVTVKYFDLGLRSEITETLHARDAQVFMHEYHHLLGKLICDVGSPIKE